MKTVVEVRQGMVTLFVHIREYPALRETLIGFRDRYGLRPGVGVHGDVPKDFHCFDLWNYNGSYQDIQWQLESVLSGEKDSEKQD